MKMKCQEIRVIIQARGIMLDHGYDALEVSFLTKARDDYIHGMHKGLPIYLSQMLNSGQLEDLSIGVRIVYFHEVFPQSVQWKRLRGRVGLRVGNNRLPGDLVDYFIAQSNGAEEGLILCLRFLAQGT